MLKQNTVYKLKDSTLLISLVDSKLCFTSLINAEQTEVEFDETIPLLFEKNRLEEIKKEDIHISWKEYLNID